jgi:hypothetical protein
MGREGSWCERWEGIKEAASPISPEWRYAIKARA